jgi:Putative transposase/Transposase zinc-binding domain
MTSFERPEIELADIFNQFRYLLGNLSPEKAKVVQDIQNCRTAVLGGHLEKCNHCEHEKNRYNSCRNRHCPKCQYLAQVKWIEKRTTELLPSPYFHVVFTVPSELNPLMLRNKRLAYDLLFRAASETLREVAATPRNLGADIGAIGVLHTWSQTLLNHPHIHFIVPGGGLNRARNKWIPCKKGYFLPVQILSKVFRGKFLGYLENARDKLSYPGKIADLASRSSFKHLLITAAKNEWVVYAKEPFAGPKQVINYLGRYTHRIAISNYRLVKLEGEVVHFKYRDRENPGSSKIMALGVREFMRRFLLHVLPKRYVRIRHFGMLGNRLKKLNISIVRRLEGIVETAREEVAIGWQALLKIVSGIDVTRCPKCQLGSLVIHKTLLRGDNSS